MGILMGDVGGRGVTAALLMAMGQTFVKSFMQQGVAPADCLTQLNSMLFADGLPHVGLDLIAATLNPSTGALELANAGHTAPFILRSNGALDSIDESSSGIWEMSDLSLEAKSDTLQTGDAMVLLSKGMMDTRNDAGARYSRERMASTLRDTEDSKPTSLIRHLVRAVQEHAEDVEPREDLTILAARVV